MWSVEHLKPSTTEFFMPNMKEKILRGICLCVALLGIRFGEPVFAAPAAGSPNIIVVLIDDMGWADLSCFGNKAIQTPHIDRLASEGVAFTQFYVSAPICSPSRCGITTGQYPYRWRITSYLDNRANNEARGMAQWLDLQAPVLARFFQEAGYATGHFGKWHLGGQRDVGDAPLITEYGFDESLTNFEGLGPRVLPLLNTFDGSEPRKYALGSDNLGKGTIRWENRNKVTTCFVDKALEFIKKAESDNKPFYVNLWPDDVHSPFFPASELRGDGSKKDLYHGVLVELDRQLAPLFDYVRGNEKLRDNTLILLLSDNGPEPGAGTSAPLRGSKGMLYEGGTRSPLIVWGQGFVKTDAVGTKNEDAVFQSVDLVPSLLKAAGIQTKIVFDGEDFSEVLLGRKKTQDRQAPIFWRRPPDRSGPADAPWPDLAMRDGSWKFLMRFDGSAPELYDLASDASESANLAEKHPELVEKYTERLRRWNADLPKDAGEQSSMPGLKFEWDAQKTSAPRDRSGNGNTIQIEGTVPRKSDAQGDFGKFDGQSFIHVPNSPALDFARTPLRVEVVLEPDCTDAVVLARGGVKQGFALFLRAGKPGFAVTIDGETYSALSDHPITGWTELRGRLTPYRLELYVNDDRVATIPGPGLIPDNPRDAMQIGHDRDGKVLHETLPVFRGKMRRVSLWREAFPKNGNDTKRFRLGISPEFVSSPSPVFIGQRRMPST